MILAVLNPGDYVYYNADGFFYKIIDKDNIDYTYQCVDLIENKAYLNSLSRYEFEFPIASFQYTRFASEEEIKQCEKLIQLETMKFILEK